MTYWWLATKYLPMWLVVLGVVLYLLTLLLWPSIKTLYGFAKEYGALMLLRALFGRPG